MTINLNRRRFVQGAVALSAATSTGANISAVATTAAHLAAGKLELSVRPNGRAPALLRPSPYKPLI